MHEIVLGGQKQAFFVNGQKLPMRDTPAGLPAAALASFGAPSAFWTSAAELARASCAAPLTFVAVASAELPAWAGSSAPSAAGGSAELPAAGAFSTLSAALGASATSEAPRLLSRSNTMASALALAAERGSAETGRGALEAASEAA